MGEPAERIHAPDGPEPLRLVRNFESDFRALFDTHFPKLFRYLDRLGGDPDLAADLAQEAFIRLYRRGAFPDAPEAWLVTVAMNLFRNRRTAVSRRARLLSVFRGEGAHSDPPGDPLSTTQAEETRRQVRSALDRLPERDRQLLLLRAEGYAYRDLADMVGVAEASVGTLLARAKEAFKRELHDAS